MNTRKLAGTLVALLSSGGAFGHGGQISGTGSTSREAIGPVIYTNPAYTHAISGTPNPAMESVSTESGLIYVDPAFGQAIYSYPGHPAASMMRNGR
jgi:hypothetical protein